MQPRKVIICLVAFLLITVGSLGWTVQADEGHWPSGIEPTGILRLATIGDPHYGWLDVDRFWAHDIVDAWMFDEEFPAVDLAVNVGDFVSGDYYDTEAEIEAMWEHAKTDSFSRLIVPWVFAMGNHDVEEGKPNIDTEHRVAIAKRETGVMQRCYAFMWDNVLFLVQGWKGRGGLSDDQKVWFHYMTKAHPDTTTVIIRHAGPNEWWEEFFADNPQIALYLYGHGHEFRQRTVQGVQVVEYGHTNSSVSWVGRPWTGYVEITEAGIAGRIYDVLERSWIEDRGFRLDVETGIKPTGLEWYSWTRFVEDGTTFSVNNRILAEEYCMELIGAQSGAVDGEASQDLVVSLNDTASFESENLAPLSVEAFALDQNLISNDLHFDVDIGGSGVGFVRMVYVRPLLWSQDVSIGDADRGDQGYAVRLERVARYLSDDKATLCPLRMGVTVPEAEAVSLREGSYTSYRLAVSSLPRTTVVEVEAPAQPHITISGFTVPESVQQFDRFVVTAVVTNTGGPTRAKIGLSVDSEPVEFKYVVLGKDESAHLSYELEFKSAGQHEIAITGQEGETLNVVAGLPF